MPLHTPVRVASGTASVAVTNGTSTGSDAVSFPAGRFTATPRVTATIASSLTSSNRGKFHARVTGLSTSGCTIHVMSGDGSNILVNDTYTVHWIACQEHPW